MPDSRRAAGGEDGAVAGEGIRLRRPRVRRNPSNPLSLAGAAVWPRAQSQPSGSSRGCPRSRGVGHAGRTPAGQREERPAGRPPWHRGTSLPKVARKTGAS